MTQTTSRISASNPATGIFGRFLRATEIDTRLLGMVGALVAIWVGFHIYGIVANGSGVFLTPRNLWNLSVQTASIGIMACGMVLVIITRHIDLSVGSLLGFAAMVMGITQVWVLPQWLGLGHPAIWIIASIVGMSVGASIGAFHGWLVAYRGIPAFIVTLGGLLVWRGAAFLLARGETISPVDANFALIGGGPYGSIGATGSWIVGLAACSGIVWLLVQGRKQRLKFDFPLRPMWAEYTLGVLGCGLVIGSVLLVNAYPWPRGIVNQYAAAQGIEVPEGGLFISHGFAIPVLVLAVVGIGMTFLMTRTRFGRYVLAIGGNPDAAELAGIDTRWMTVKIFALMGFLTGLSAVVASARLNSATNSLGQLDELYVIAAAVIGGTSLAGGVGTIYGAIIGALVMQSLKTGMVLIGFDAAMQDIVVGIVLVLAVYVDKLYRSRAK
ncbi:MAG: sugar ABC transporter permease [Rhodobacteraceae bacterium]|jgi:D-xylose transport system permease protein|uniref:sugar ABC transporter permease n=1 Tax=Albidovulum sp. TaxID=1872424 RepID=UPI001D82E11D|nr:sugar ABC transporter permease [uncultured Defluviimonas sp.]MCB2125154.1 sugar ABC transporter permease [Paracoccaceae bacterium]MCC0070830.1 sugar ABC transporter permease [Paracoccaceae bacterium]